MLNKKTGEVVTCTGIWATDAEKSFSAMDGKSTAWGYGEEYPLTPTEKNFKYGEYIRLKINDGWELVPDPRKKLRRRIEDALRKNTSYEQLVLIADILNIAI
jgi:hypothetical protein